jgi:hypothetical protein
MDDQQAHQTRQIHAVESAVGLVASPFVYHAGGSMVSQEQKMAAHYDAALQIQHQQMHQHIAAVSHMQQAAQIIPQVSGHIKTIFSKTQLRRKQMNIFK